MLTSEKPFFDPVAGTSPKIAGLVTQPSVVSTTGTSHVQATRNVASFTATQPVAPPDARMKTATQLVEAPGARPVVHSKAIGASSGEIQVTRLVDQSLTG